MYIVQSINAIGLLYTPRFIIITNFSGYLQVQLWSYICSILKYIKLLYVNFKLCNR